MAKEAKDMNWQSCQTMIGMEPITEQRLQDLIDEQAEKKGFNKVCELNSKARKDTVCSRKCDTKYDVKETAGFLEVDEDVVSINAFFICVRHEILKYSRKNRSGTKVNEHFHSPSQSPSPSPSPSPS